MTEHKCVDERGFSACGCHDYVETTRTTGETATVSSSPAGEGAQETHQRALPERIKSWRESDMTGYDSAIELLCEAEAELNIEKRVTEDRRALWLDHGCSVAGLYGDDGEMQCSSLRHGPLDFKRDPLPLLVRRLVDAPKP